MEHTAEQTIVIVRGGAGYARVTMRGLLDHHFAQRLQIQLDAVLDTGARYLTVDISEVNFCEENVLDMLDMLRCAERRASSQLGWLALTGGHYRLRFAAPPGPTSTGTAVCAAG